MTFVTPSRQFKFLCTMMGLSLSKDKYKRCGNKAIGDVGNTNKAF